MSVANHFLRNVSKVLQQLISRAPGNSTDKQPLLEQFREHDFFLNQSQNIARVGSWIWDTQSDLVKWSDYLVEMFDLKAEDVPSTYRGYLKLLPANERDYVNSCIEKAHQNKAAFTFEHHLVTRSGERRLLRCRGQVIVENHKVKAMIGTSQDITEQKQFEEHLRSRKKEAEDSNSAKSRFLANMSHEIRTPISAILGFTELLADNSVSDETKQTYLALIRTNASWLTELVENILDLSKIESGKIETEKVKIDLTAFLMRIRDLVQPTPSDQDMLSVEFEFNGKLPRTISTDPTRLRQILINLIRNAQKFTPVGRIVVKTRMARSGSQPKLLFYVCDTGIGMTSEEQHKVFMAFTQADATTTRRFGGTGLGLTLAKRLASVIGGDVRIIRSRPGSGSIFKVEIPCVEETDHISITSLPQSKLASNGNADDLLKNRSILLVDDSKDNREIIKRFLEKAGAVVATAEDGQAALEKLKKQRFDLVLMDIQMPIMDGLRATKEIRKTDSRTPIVALTAHALEEEKRKCLQSGFDDYLTKPINRQLLLQHVAQEIHSSLH